MKRPTRRTHRRRNRLRRLMMQPMEQRMLLAGDLPFGATPIDTGEFLLGTVTVTPVFFESDGSIDVSTEDWDAAEIDQTLEKIRESVDWWSDLLGTKTDKHSLEFSIDDTWARSPVSTGYEPINRSSTTFQRYVGDWLTDLGYGDAPSIERAMHLFNDSQRQTHETDWAFTIFVVDSENDQDGFFASGGFSGAFAYPGGLFYVVPSERPVSTYSHEMGHIFYARDEYPGAGNWTDRRGYYNAQNLNAWDNPTAGFVQETSIMRGGGVATVAYDRLESPETTLALLGWQDSDDDGIFDVADVPLSLDAVGWFDAVSSSFFLRGSASVETLANANSAGFQSDITLARVGAVQYRLDDGPWQTVLTPDQTHVDVDIQVPISGEFDTIQWRAIDTATGVASPLLSASALQPAFSGRGGGYAFLDENANGVRDDGENLLGGTTFTVLTSDDTALPQVAIEAELLPDEEITPPAGLTVQSLGDFTDGRVAVFASTLPQAPRVFHAYDPSLFSWQSNWGSDRRLEVESDSPTGRVEVDFMALDTGTYGLESGSYARIEVFDALGNRIDRLTSPLTAANESGRLIVEDSFGRISRVVIQGHAETEIQISAVRFGETSAPDVGAEGTVSLDRLAQGDYAVSAFASNLIYQFAQPKVTVELTAEGSVLVGMAATRVDSPRYNTDLAGDVNRDGEVTAHDALVVINDLGRLGNRTLTSDELTGFAVDVNNDGMVTPIDALRVINILGVSAEGESGPDLPPNGARSNQPLQNTDSDVTASQSTQQLIASLPAPQVDAALSDYRQDDNTTPDGWSAENLTPSKMWNSAGNTTSDQSHGDASSDDTAGEDVRRRAQTGGDHGLENLVAGFSDQKRDFSRIPPKGG